MTDTTTVIRVGDYVTWQNKVKQKLQPTTLPLKVTGCKVIELYDVEGKAAAKIDCGRLFGQVVAFVADLDLEPDERLESPRTTIISGG